MTADRFTGRTVIATGAGSGTGRAVASRIAREGGHVIAVDIAASGLVATAAALPDDLFTAVVADLTTESGVAAVLDAAGDRIDGLANVAGLLDDFGPRTRSPTPWCSGSSR